MVNEPSAFELLSFDFTLYLPSKTGSILNGKNLLLRGENSFLLVQTTFEKKEGWQNEFVGIASRASVFIPPTRACCYKRDDP